MGYQSAAVMPSAAIIPMRSNVKMYGPYASSNFGNSAGGTSVAVDVDLCPWVFGSTAAMNAAGLSIVESSAIGLNRAETGGVTIPGLPDLDSLGTTVGGAGPNLTNISFTFGSGGVTTTYDFKTYTPKFGSLNRHFIHKFKDISKNRQEQLKFLRTSQIVQNKIGRKIQNTKRTPSSPNTLPGNNTESSLQRILVAEMYDWDGAENNQSQRTVVGTNSLNRSVNEMTFDYDKKAYMSWDGLIGPVSLNGDGGLPRYAKFNPEGHKSSPISPQPPFSLSGQCNLSMTHNEYNLEITQQYVNPLTNSFDSDEHHHNGPGAGHAIDILGKGDQVPNSGIIINMYRPDDNDKYADDYRFIAMRGPIVLHSWGYDLDGKPVPNASDTEEAAKQGIFKNTYLKDEFLQDWLKKPASWPAAPIDLRFDRERGLWVSPQSYKIVVAKITEPVLCYSEGKAVVVPYGKPIFDKEGVKINPDYGDIQNCEDGLNKKEYEWILVNITPCTSDNIKWYCFTNGSDELGNMTFICESTDDPLFRGAENAVSGPYNSAAECPCTVPSVTPTPSPTPPLTTSVITGVTLSGGGLVFTYAVIQIAEIISSGSTTIGTIECGVTPTPTPTQTETPTPTPTPTGTPTPTPTATTTPTPTPTPTPSPSPTISTEEPERGAPVMINVVDRLGRKHQVGELVYAYFDTSTEKYIVLERRPDPITPIIYGVYSPIDETEGNLIVEYAAGIEYCDDGIRNGSVVAVKNKLKLSANCAGPAMAIKMEKLK
jgi:hypothetical protein